VAEGATSCTACGSGEYTEVEASTSCSACPKGKYQGSTGQAACLECTAGTVSTVSGLASCEACSSSRTSSPGSTKCDQALVSYYIYNTSSTNYIVSNCLCEGGYALPVPKAGYWSDRSKSQYLSSPYKCSRSTCKGAAVTVSTVIEITQSNVGVSRPLMPIIVMAIDVILMTYFAHRAHMDRYVAVANRDILSPLSIWFVLNVNPVALSIRTCSLVFYLSSVFLSLWFTSKS